MVTLGERGASWLNRIYPTDPVDVFDASGAGDSFFAGLIVFMVNTDRKISRLEKEFLDEKG